MTPALRMHFYSQDYSFYVLLGCSVKSIPELLHGTEYKTGTHLVTDKRASHLATPHHKLTNIIKPWAEGLWIPLVEGKTGLEWGWWTAVHLPPLKNPASCGWKKTFYYYSVILFPLSSSFHFKISWPALDLKSCFSVSFFTSYYKKTKFLFG